MGKILPFDNKKPKVAKDVFVAPDALIIGDAEIGEKTSIWYGAIVRADVHWIKIGKKTNIQDKCICHVTEGTAPLIVGDEVTVGHGAILHGCEVKNRVLAGMGAIILDNAKIGEGSLIAAGALVPPDKIIPPKSLVVGVPAQIKRQVTQDELNMILASAEHYYRLSRNHAQIWGVGEEKKAGELNRARASGAASAEKHGALAAVLFDMDGVVIDSMGEHARAWIEAAGHYGIQVTDEDVFKREGEQGIVTARDFLAKLEGARATKKTAQELLNMKEEIFKNSSKIRPFAGIEKVLDELKSRGFKLGLVTGTSSGELARVLPEKIAARFDTVVSGDSVKRGKPYPDPYLFACMNLGVKPKDAIAIENAPYGVKSAKSAGVFCIAITTYLLPAELEGADIIINSHGEIVPTVLKLSAGEK